MIVVPQIRRRLLVWYDAHRRDLPWRARPGQTADPYRVWLSEIMLQQTTVAHATRYFEAFTARWPSVRALAAAADAEVMGAWAGLGYYARARNLLACARAVARDQEGCFPDLEEGLRRLPGVGAYTAAAIAAIAFQRPANVVDGNVERVMARLYAVETPLPAAKTTLASLAGGLVLDERPGDWAQALMDLGATVCRPRAPLCGDCPIAAECMARAGGSPETYPRRSPKAARPHRHGIAFMVVRPGDVVAMTLRPAKGLLGGMLGLPTTAWRSMPWSIGEIRRAAPNPGPWRELGVIEHVFTHFSLTLRVLAREAEKGFATADGQLSWMELARAKAASPSLFRKALELWDPPAP